MNRSLRSKNTDKTYPTSKPARNVFPKECRTLLLDDDESFHRKTPMTACRTQRRSEPSL